MSRGRYPRNYTTGVTKDAHAALLKAARERGEAVKVTASRIILQALNPITADEFSALVEKAIKS